MSDDPKFQKLLLENACFREYVLRNPIPKGLSAARYAAAYESGVAEERARWKKVTAFAEPRGQYKLALKLCGDSDLSADDLIVVLMAAPREMPLTGLAAHMARIVHAPGHS